MYGGNGPGQNRSRQIPDEEHDGEHEPFPELCADIGPGRQLAPAAADGPRGFHGIAEQDKERNEEQPEEQQTEGTDRQPAEPVARSENEAKGFPYIDLNRLRQRYTHRLPPL